MSNGQLTFADLYKDVSEFLGLGRSPAGADLDLAQRYANDGYRDFLMGNDPRTGRAYTWSFLSPTGSLTVWPALVAEAGVTVSGVYDAPSNLTTLTASRDCFFPSMVGHAVEIAGAGIFPIAAYVGPSSVNVTGSAAAVTGAGLTIAADGGYSLPPDFVAMLDDFTFPPGAAACSPQRLAPRSPQLIRQLQAAVGPSAGRPRYYAIQPRGGVASPQLYEALVWPGPSEPWTLRYRYRIAPAPLASDGDVPLGGSLHASTIIEAALMVAEQRHNDAAGVHTARFHELMAASIRQDAANAPAVLGECVDPSDPVRVMGRRGGAVRYL